MSTIRQSLASAAAGGGGTAAASGPAAAWRRLALGALGGGLVVAAAVVLLRRLTGDDGNDADVEFSRNPAKPTGHRAAGATGHASASAGHRRGTSPSSQPTTEPDGRRPKPGFDYDDMAPWRDDDAEARREGWRLHDEYEEGEEDEEGEWSTEYSDMSETEHEEFKQAVMTAIYQRLEELNAKKAAGKKLTKSEEQEIANMNEDLHELLKDEFAAARAERSRHAQAMMPRFGPNGELLAGGGGVRFAPDGGFVPGEDDDDAIDLDDDGPDPYGDAAGAWQRATGMVPNHPSAFMGLVGDDGEFFDEEDEEEGDAAKAAKKRRKKVKAKSVVKKGYARRADDFAAKVAAGGVPV